MDSMLFRSYHYERRKNSPKKEYVNFKYIKDPLLLPPVRSKWVLPLKDHNTDLHAITFNTRPLYFYYMPWKEI